MPTIPLTFLFTDIEGSTRLWEAHPEAMRADLARHDAIMRLAIEAHGGRVFKTMGDAFYAVFELPLNAALAAIAAQKAFLAETWGVGQLRVRMALHIDQVEARDDDFFGPGLNRLARLISAGHGGQILLSAALNERLKLSLPTEARLVALGEHRLKDLTHPERIFQLLAPGLLDRFPPLRSLEAFKHNLPMQLTSFVGREKEIAAVKHYLTETRLLTLLGMGGTGKTRLSLQTGAELIDSFSNGVWFIDLAPITDGSQIERAIIAAFGMREEAGQAPLASLAEYVQSRALLLILDNCEHLVQDSARVADALLRAGSQIQILATSREALNIPGEAIYAVPTLALPDTPQAINQSEAVRLFVERATAAQPRFRLTPQNAELVLEICRRLDGLPLALELAAARTRAMSLEHIVARLNDRFRLLTGGSRVALPRQQTLQALVDWSYDLLSEAEKTLLRRLSVFAGSWSLEAAEQVVGLDALDVFDGVARLVEKSLVILEERDGETRYRMLETIRQYAREKLLAARESDLIRQNHLRYFSRLVEQAEPELWRFNQKLWLDRLDMERDNWRVALEWSLQAEDPASLELGQRLAGAMCYFWRVRGYWNEGAEWYTALLNRQEATSPAVRAKLLNEAGFLFIDHRAHAQPEKYHIEALQLSRAIGDTTQEALALLGHGYYAQRTSLQEAHNYFQASLEIFEALDEPVGQLLALAGLGSVAAARGDKDHQLDYYTRNLALCDAIGHRLGRAGTLISIGGLNLDNGNLAAARALAQESIAIYKEVNDQPGLGFALRWLSNVLRREGDLEGAYAAITEGLELFQRLGAAVEVAGFLGMQGYTLALQGHWERALQILQQVLQIRRTQNNAGLVRGPLVLLGEALRMHGDYEAARQCYEEVAALTPDQDDRTLLLNDHNLGHTYHHLGHYARAQAYFAQALRRCNLKNDQVIAALCLVGVAGVLLSATQARDMPQPAALAQAARLLGLAQTILTPAASTLDEVDRIEVRHCIALLQTHVTDGDRERWLAEGEQLDLAKAVAWCLAQTPGEIE